MCRFVVVLAAGLVCNACAMDWPQMDSVVYTGVVTNGATGLPEAKVTVTAYRKRKRGVNLFGWEELGSATTSSSGEYELTTSGGYAQSLRAQSFDNRLWAWHEPFFKPTSKVDLTVKPGITSVGTSAGIRPRYGSVVFKGENAMERIVWDIARNPAAPQLSLREYGERGVVTPSELQLFDEYSEFFRWPNPPIRFDWGDGTMEFHNIDVPIVWRVR